jgi:hypothetical protein
VKNFLLRDGKLSGSSMVRYSQTCIKTRGGGPGQSHVHHDYFLSFFRTVHHQYFLPVHLSYT